jgi:hypothetical protein
MFKLHYNFRKGSAEIIIVQNFLHFLQHYFLLSKNIAVSLQRFKL